MSTKVRLQEEEDGFYVEPLSGKLVPFTDDSSLDAWIKQNIESGLAQEWYDAVYRKKRWIDELPIELRDIRF